MEKKVEVTILNQPYLFVGDDEEKIDDVLVLRGVDADGHASPPLPLALAWSIFVISSRQ